MFERERRKVLVTPAGEEVVSRARRVLAEAHGLAEAADALRHPLSGSLRLRLIPTIAPYLLPSVLPRVRKRHPKLRLRLHEGPTAELVAMLQRGELDVLLVALEAPLAGLATRALAGDSFVAAMPSAHPLARKRRLREQALSICRKAGADEADEFRASSLATLVEMVAGGAGITLLPSLALRVAGRRPDLAFVPFEAPAPRRTIGLAWRPSSGRTAEFELLAEPLAPSRAHGAARPRA